MKLFGETMDVEVHTIIIPLPLRKYYNGRMNLAEFEEAEKNILRAHSAVSYAVSRGGLVRPDACSDCGLEGRIHGHHEDYSKPLDVVWLCPRCHKKRHPDNGRGRRTKWMHYLGITV
jgi:hypothetical protein